MSGLKKLLQTRTGIDANHWGITHIQGNWSVQEGEIVGRVEVVISGWATKQARLDGWAPIGHISEEFGTGAAGLLADFVHGKLKKLDKWTDAIDEA